MGGLEKMDYVWTVNGKEVFNMTQPDITKEILSSGLTMVVQIERGTFIVPSFDEIWPQAGKEGPGGGKKKRMGIDYILEAMQHHGLGHLPQPDNFTTCGRLGIEVNQYNNPIECYSDDTIEDMRDEKVVLDNPDLAEKMIKGNAEKHQVTPWQHRKCNISTPRGAPSSWPSTPQKRFLGSRRKAWLLKIVCCDVVTVGRVIA